MDRIRAMFVSPNKTVYKPVGLEDGGEDEALIRGGQREEEGVDARTIGEVEDVQVPFQWLYYTIFVMLGVAMLWAWNMFLAAGPYFQSRFKGNDWLVANFQSAELTVSTVANLGSLLILTNMQAGASYPKRIVTSLVLNIGIFAMLALSTITFLDISPKGYFVFLMVQIFFSSAFTGLMQNGIFAYMASFGREEYAQGNMTGQAIAGILPCIVQIVSVLSIPPVDATKADDPETRKTASKSALVYFATAGGVSVITLSAFLYLLAVHRRSGTRDILSRSTSSLPPRQLKRVPLTVLYRKTFFLSTAVFLTFAIAMFFPVFTQRILSTHTAPLPRLLQPPSFIPLSFLLWNAGDLFGRVLAALPSLRLTHRPRAILALAACRVLFIPLYYLCNVDGAGARIPSDTFYFAVQLAYGATNGFLGTTCLMGAGECVDTDEREAAGSFMALMLVGGLATGSVLSFSVG